MIVGGHLGEVCQRTYPVVTKLTISGAYSWAIWRTSSGLRVARGLGRVTIRVPGIPNAVARAWAALVKELVITLTVGTPLDSVSTASWRPHAVQDPQSATAWTMTSHFSLSDSRVSGAQGAL